jgi:hypothetical protein
MVQGNVQSLDLNNNLLLSLAVSLGFLSFSMLGVLSDSWASGNFNLLVTVAVIA